MSRKNGGIIGPANTPVGGLFSGVAGGVWRMNDVLNFVNNSQWPKAPGNIDNSLRFNDDDSANLTKTDSSSNRKTFTYSAWVKKSQAKTDTDSNMIFNNAADESNQFKIELEGNHALDNNDLRIRQMASGSQTVLLRTNRLFRDPSAWYHIVVAVDTTQSTDSNRVKLYVNGVQETSFSSSTYPSQDSDMQVNVSSSYTTHIGKRNNSDHYFDGYMAELVFIDGQALTPSSFGETDSTTGIWKPKKIGAISGAGTNSFYLNFKDSSNLGNDASGNGNNFTANNLTSIDQTTDTCVENYATMNPLDNYLQSSTFSEGNLKMITSSSPYNYNSSNFGVSSGKWYCEVKMTAHSETDGNNYSMIGITSKLTTSTTDYLGQNASDWSYNAFDGKYRNNGSNTSYGNSYAVGDIIGIALDLDNNKLYFSKNGTFQNSGVPTSGSTGTGAISITAAASTPIGAYFIAIGYYDGSDTGTFEFNSGNPSFSISSGNADANGFGNFEYSVPSGYYALNTSNLNTYG